MGCASNPLGDALALTSQGEVEPCPPGQSKHRHSHARLIMVGAHGGCSWWVLVVGATSQRQLEALSPGGARRAVGHARAHAAERVEHAVLVLEARHAVRVERLVQERQLARRAVGRAHEEDVQEARLGLGQGQG